MGILSSILGGIPIVGPALSAMAGGSEKEDQANQNLQVQGANALTNRMAVAAGLPSDRLRTAIQAALTSSAQPATVNWGGPGSGLKGQVPTYSGGIKSIYSAMQNPNVRSLGNRITTDELLSQMRGGASGGNADIAMPTGIGQESLLNKVLGGAGMLGSGWAAVKGALDKQAGSQTNDPALIYGPNEPSSIYGDDPNYGEGGDEGV